MCGPGSFVLLKALACGRRGERKGKYDLFYFARNYGDGPADVAECYQPFLDENNPNAEKAVEILEDYFEHANSRGPNDVSRFVYGNENDELKADAAAFVNEFLEELDR